MKEYINDALSRYVEEDRYPWHMPGHKRVDVIHQNGKTEEDIWSQVYARDFTEAWELDDMQEPELFIKDSLEEMKNIYHTEATFMLVNGATGGILAALYACCPEGAVILMARNCHKSVYNGVSLLKLKPEYVVPDIIPGTDILGDVSADMIREKLEYLVKQGKTPAAVIITSPTYEGVISDIRAIKEILAPYGIPLIVDSAHGAHLTFMGKNYPASSMREGGDIVIESTHKTLPTMTQTALLHVMKPELLPQVKKYLKVFQTSSPSYIFMQSIERGIAWCDSHRDEFIRYRQRIEVFRQKCKSFKYITLLNTEKTCYAYDVCKLVFVIKKGTILKGTNICFNGALFQQILAERYNQIMEMCSASYVLAITSVADKMEAYDRLYHIISEIDNMLDAGNLYDSAIGTCYEFHIPQSLMTPGQAWNLQAVSMKLAVAMGHISAGYIYAYPPGISVIVPGEIIDEIVVEDIIRMVENKLNVIGIDMKDENIYVNVVE